jgi:hydrogenase expression/formation protein HypC
MCLAVPMKLIEIAPDGSGKVEAGEVTYSINLTLVPHARVSDYLIIHAGFAISVLDEEEAKKTLELFTDTSVEDV